MAGFMLLLLASELGALGLRSLPMAWAAWLGVVPIAIGAVNAWRWWSTRNLQSEHPHGVLATFPSAFSLILATGGDNVSAYIPVFYAAGEKALLICVAYAIAFAIVTWVARLAFGSATVHSMLHRVAQPLTSAVLILVGLAMLAGLLRPG
jgi:cadmium resistance protein CadD (predicted permease)